MNNALKLKAFIVVMAMATFSGCANYGVNTTRGNIPGYLIRTEMQEADRAVEAARNAGKDKVCPAEFKAAEAARDNAYDVYRACHTEEGAALAKQATAKANALCPPAPAPAPVAVEPVPAPVIPAAPTAALTVIPATVVKGQTATLNWKSQNASKCTIQPDIGSVPPQGVRAITPAYDTTYNLACSGAGGTASSAAAVAVTAPPVPAPAPVPVPAKPVVTAAAERFCSKPAVINVQFDTDKSVVKSHYDADLKTLSDFLKEFSNAKGEISGHTDNVGSKAYNDKLSQARADSVKKYLVEKFGISGDRISAKGYGFSKPVASNKTKEGKSKNRRIEANFTCEN